MLIVPTTSSTIEVVLSGVVTTNQLEYYASWVDVLATDQSVSAFNESDGLTNNATAVTVVASPLNNHTRTVKYLSVFNADTVDATVIVRFYNGTNRRRLVTVTLKTGETLEYNG